MTETPFGKLYETVVNVIIEQIRHGKYRISDKLPPERELSLEFNVSRPTIREAMIALEVMGIVKTRKGSGVFIANAQPARFDGFDLKVGAFELAEARLFYEGETAALAALSATPEDIARLEQFLQDMRIEAANGPGIEESDKDFHIGIAEATHNAAMIGVVRYLWDLRRTNMLPMFADAQVRRKGYTPALNEHEQILEAIKSHDAARARTAMRDHLHRVVEMMLDSTEDELISETIKFNTNQKDKLNRRVAL
ncbi:FadR/GntR family transcriptional regulator [Asticcacaulis sp. DXS10W]|uniref:FadR/GntR family transcriptional regulator n=1 Tax=Asticcacaulis currens TaxID=2984210 RepID=A0ABT5IE23_9CAUL|nr:FadR/GntR family transcriptional regulator [Asticcacaulis currens]MDC7693701.1 FadR/GntR family transcriptional regulator [Asticcacaulis currens]